MDLGLQNKVIVISGGGRGISETVSHVLCAEGAIVVMLGSDETDPQLLEKRGGHNLFSVGIGNRTPDDFEKAILAIIQKTGRIDGLVNTAPLNGVPGSPSGNHTGFTSGLQDYLMSYYLTTHFALPHLIKSKSPIVNVSMENNETKDANAHLAAARGACEALTREWAVELLKYGIRSNAVLTVRRGKLHKDPGFDLPAQPDVAVTTHGIAQTVAFLLSRKSSHTTGQLIYVE